MSEGQIIFTGKTKKDLDISVRYPTSQDTQILLDYINTLSAEKTFVRFQGEQTDFDSEQKYLRSQLERIRNQKAVMLLVFNNSKLIGVSDVGMKDMAEKHIGYLGISVAKEFRGKGVGGFLLKQIIDESKKNLTDLKILVLSVFGDNSVAQNMYKGAGFLEFGKLPGGILHDNKPVDHIYMYKLV